jgi:hypothetical protein
VLAHKRSFRDGQEKITIELMTAAALLLDGWAGHRAIGAKNAAIAGLWFQQRFTPRALVKILAGVRWHDLLPLLPADRAGKHGLQDNGAHGFAMSFDGNPASVVA